MTARTVSSAHFFAVFFVFCHDAKKRGSVTVSEYSFAAASQMSGFQTDQLVLYL